MKGSIKGLIIGVCLFSNVPIHADVFNSNNARQTEENTGDIKQYLLNLSSYLGYNVTKPNQNANSELLNLPLTQLMETLLFSTLFGSIPISSQPNFAFVSPNAVGADMINQQANATFAQQKYSTQTSGQQGTTVSVSSLMDQQPYQNDPVSQSLLNMLSTPDNSYCMDTNGIPQNPCTNIQPLLYQGQVLGNILGTIPNNPPYFAFQNVKDLLPQLNSNSLIAPLYFDTSTNPDQESTSTPSAADSPKNLSAQNQAQQAQNFIRYVSGGVLPLSLPNQNAYNSLYNKAYPAAGNTVAPQAQAKALNTLNTFIASLRIYAAQTSVGLGNLYYILSKRLPQNADENKTGVSQAMSEHMMASWRLVKPGVNGTTSQSQQWIETINAASSASVQKEIAILLAEINYQLYLDRQIQERILMTQSVMVLQNTKLAKPSSDLSNQDDGASGE